jgi:light-regulated signal transduction histidine kinase (bacteriophytochrome)
MDAEERRLLGVIQTDAMRMDHLIESLLAFSRMKLKDLQKHPVDMDQLVREVVAEHALGSDRPAAVTIQPLGEVLADPILLRQVVANLISNAVKFTRNNPAPQVTVGAYAEPGERVYFVRDNGIGFDMRYANKLFGVFQRLHSASEFEGNGVGLAIANRILERHGGRIWAESAVDQGATFFFALPAGGTDTEAGSSTTTRRSTALPSP